jgi:hypothetical protein
MKNHIKSLRPLVLGLFTISIIFSISCLAQTKQVKDTMHPTLEELVNASDFVVECMAIKNAECFINKDSVIYTSVTLKISKVFKGDISDSLLEIVYKGGVYPGITLPYQSVSHGFSIGKGDDGIFFLKSNKIVSLKTELHSFYPTFHEIKYNHNSYLHSAAMNANLVFDDIENELYKGIELVTHTPRKIIGLNSFERESAKRDNK